MPAQQSGREADIQDPPRRCIQVGLDVEDENIFDGHREHRRHALQEVAQQRGQEVLLGHVLETDGDTAAQHVLGDDEDSENALGRNAVDSIWEIKQKKNELRNDQKQKFSSNTTQHKKSWFYSGHVGSKHADVQAFKRRQSLRKSSKDNAEAPGIIKTEWRGRKYMGRGDPEFKWHDEKLNEEKKECDSGRWRVSET